MTEFRLFDDPGADVAQITTDGATIKPFLNAIHRVAEEARIAIRGDGLHTTMVDAANVFMVEADLSAESFDAFTLEQQADIGVSLKALKNLVRRARMRHDDTLMLTINEREITATVTRGYEDNNVVSEGTMNLIDADSIRQSPEFPEFDTSDMAHITVGQAPFVDALSYGSEVGDYTQIETKGVNQHAHALYIGGENDTTTEQAAVDNIDVDTSVSAMFSNDYIGDFIGAVGDVSPESVEIILGDDVPVTFEMSNAEMDATYLLAPRIQQ